MLRPVVYAFIDSQNLNLGVRSQGWVLDFHKFRRYLRDKFRVSKALLFIGYVEKYQSLYHKLTSFDYILVFKPTVMSRNSKTKGNIDAELVLYAAAIEYQQYHKAVIVSGDGDFYCLYEFLDQRNKLLRIIIPNNKSESSLLKKFANYRVCLNFEKNRLAIKIGGRCL
ncbi:MAG TPA: NYN domain-containing protein [Candidatus Woesebacteria bacterium]|nr:NYN domain-containing protein [Candidatus Woesebacteria bacterium]